MLVPEMQPQHLGTGGDQGAGQGDLARRAHELRPEQAVWIVPEHKHALAAAEEAVKGPHDAFHGAAGTGSRTGSALMVSTPTAPRAIPGWFGRLAPCGHPYAG